MKNKRIVFFTKDSLETKVLAHELNKQFELAAIVIQEKKEKKKQKFIIRFLQKTIGKKVLEQILIFRKEKSERQILQTEFRLKKEATKFLERELQKFMVRGWPSVPILRTSDINSNSVDESIKALNPALIVVWGTGIIRKNIIEIPAQGIINAHTSILPEYRGNFVEFWQCLNNDYEHAGVTYHFINELIDEGDVIAAEKYTGAKPTNPYALRNANLLSIISSYPRIVGNVLSGNFKRIKQETKNSKTFTFRQITIDAKKLLFARQKLL